MDPIISFRQIETITRGDQELMKQLLRLFIKENTANSQKLLDAIEVANWEELKKAAHKVKSSLALFDAETHGKLAAELEHTAGKDHSETKNKTLELLKGLQLIIQDVEQKLNSFH